MGLESFTQASFTSLSLVSIYQGVYWTAKNIRAILKEKGLDDKIRAYYYLWDGPKQPNKQPKKYTGGCQVSWFESSFDLLWFLPINKSKAYSPSKQLNLK